MAVFILICSTNGLFQKIGSGSNKSKAPVKQEMNLQPAFHNSYRNYFWVPIYNRNLYSISLSSSRILFSFYISALKAYILCRQQQCRYEAALPLFLYIIYSPVHFHILPNHFLSVQYGLSIGQNSFTTEFISQYVH